MTKEEIEEIFENTEFKKLRIVDSYGDVYKLVNMGYEDDRTTDSGEGEICAITDEGYCPIFLVSDVKEIEVIDEEFTEEQKRVAKKLGYKEDV